MKRKWLIGGLAIALVLAGAAASALAFGGSSPNARHAALQKLSNPGVPIDVGTLVPASRHLFDAREGNAIHSLGARGGKAFLTVGRVHGPDCLAISSGPPAARQLDILSCPTDAFPSASKPVYDLSLFAVGDNVFLTRLQGFASDGVTQIHVLDAAGAAIATTPVTQNVYLLDKVPSTPVSAIAGVDASGRVVFKQAVS
jgi:hypothetical protein